MLKKHFVALIAFSLVFSHVPQSEANVLRAGYKVIRLIVRAFRSAPKPSYTYNPRISPHLMRQHLAPRPMPHLGHTLDTALRSSKVEQTVRSTEMQTLIKDTIRSSGIKDPDAIGNISNVLSDRLTAILHDVSRTVPRTPLGMSTRSVDDLMPILKQRLQTLAAAEAQKEAPRFIFEVTNGKLIFPTIYRGSAVEIRGGELNAYKVLAILAAGLTCIGLDCEGKFANWFLDDQAPIPKSVFNGKSRPWILVAPSP